VRWLSALIICFAVQMCYAAVEIDVPSGVATRGERCPVTVKRDGAPAMGLLVRVIYNPGSRMERREELGRTDATGRVEWTPAETGIATIEVLSGTKSYSHEAFIEVKEGEKAVGGVPVRVIYNPDTPREIRQDLGQTDGAGRIAWRPNDGIVRVEVGERLVIASRNVAVKFERFPLSGLAIFLFAGCFLYGGLLLAFLRMRREWDIISRVE